MKHLKKFNETLNEGMFGWSYPPGAAGDPNAPWNQDDYIFEMGSELLYDVLVKRGFDKEDAENISNDFVDDDIYTDLLDKYSDSPEIDFDKETDAPIFSDEYKRLQKRAEKLHPRDYALQKGYIQKEMLRQTLAKISISPEFQEWLKKNEYLVEGMNHVKKFEAFGDNYSFYNEYKIIFDEMPPNEFDYFLQYYEEKFNEDFPESNWEDLPYEVKDCFIEWVNKNY